MDIFKKYYAANKSYYDITKGKQEVLLAKELARILGCRTEVISSFNLGRIDLMSREWLIECKYCGSTAEKNALGQLLVYQYAMNFKGDLGVAFIGIPPSSSGIRKFCKLYNISIFFYNLQSRQWGLHDDNRSFNDL